MNGEPPVKRVVAFVDGQNLFHAAREAFGCTDSNDDVATLAKEVCTEQGWECTRVCFYTGIPDAGDNRRWHFFWTHKLATMGRQGVFVFSRPLRYRNRTVTLGDGTQHSFLTGEEKGIDVRIALDVIALAHRRKYDVAFIISQDQDLSEVAVANPNDRRLFLWYKHALTTERREQPDLDSRRARPHRSTFGIGRPVGTCPHAVVSVQRIPVQKD